MKPQVGDLRTVTQRFDGEQWVLCLQSMPPKPLSDEEIDAIGDEVSSLIDTYAGRREFARAIEERHGIK